eukprot:5728938-Karenia_brevis.AAC.1
MPTMKQSNLLMRRLATSVEERISTLKAKGDKLQKMIRFIAGRWGREECGQSAKLAEGKSIQISIDKP